MTKTFKSVSAFIEAQKHEINWDDYMKIGGKVYKLYEYGGGSMFHMSHDYAYWVNKKTHDAIKIEYNCPATQWIKKGNKREKVVTQVYRFIDAEYIPSMELWRTDTL